MLEYSLRFLAGGIAVSAFAALGDTLRPKSFAGLFGAAPSIALATLLITLSQKGAPFVALEGRSMIVGAFALALYSWTVCVLLKKGPVATCVGIDWRIFGRHEAIRSCGEVNDLMVWFLGEGLPSVDLAHDDVS